MNQKKATWRLVLLSNHDPGASDVEMIQTKAAEIQTADGISVYKTPHAVESYGNIEQMKLMPCEIVFVPPGCARCWLSETGLAFATGSAAINTARGVPPICYSATSSSTLATNNALPTKPARCEIDRMVQLTGPHPGSVIISKSK